jgi:hypothetical protein
MTQRIPTNSIWQLRRRIITNFVVIWLDPDINESDGDYQNSITHLQRIIYSVHIFTDADTCVDFLSEIKKEKVFMIVSDHFGRQIMSLIEHFDQIHSIYIFCDRKADNELWTKEWSKVKGVFTQIETLCDSLKRDTQRCDKEMISISILPLTDTITFSRLSGGIQKNPSSIRYSIEL